MRELAFYNANQCSTPLGASSLWAPPKGPWAARAGFDNNHNKSDNNKRFFAPLIFTVPGLAGLGWGEPGALQRELWELRILWWFREQAVRELGVL